MLVSLCYIIASAPWDIFRLLYAYLVWKLIKACGAGRPAQQQRDLCPRSGTSRLILIFANQTPSRELIVLPTLISLVLLPKLSSQTSSGWLLNCFLVD